MTKLREIAETIEISDPEHGECDREKAFLLDAVVEERARPICLIRVLEGVRDGQEMSTNITDEDRNQALIELGLDKVWPPKEK